MKRISGISSVCMIALLLIAGCSGGATDVETPPAGDSANSRDTSADKSTDKAKAGDSKTNLPDQATVPEAIVKFIYKPIEGVTLSTEQSQKAENYINSHGNDFKAIRARRQKVLTDDLRKKRTAAIKAATATGEDPKQAELEAVGDAIFGELQKIDEDQTALINEIRQQVKDLLTKEQIKLLNVARAVRG